MSFDLTIHRDWKRDWTVWEGLREVLQNALDGWDEGYTMRIKRNGDTVVVRNTGVVLGKEVWLLGCTTKYGGDSRGQFGSGLKLGILALVRSGCRCRIINGNESWIPQFKHSVEFGEEVLHVRTHSRKQQLGYFEVRVEGVTEEDWELCCDRFLALRDAGEKYTINKNAVLLNDKYRGMIFSKGIYVNFNKRLRYGYDMSNLQVDEDRRMACDWSFRYNTAQIWNSIALLNDEIWQCYVALLKEDAFEVVDCASVSNATLGRERLRKEFYEYWGKDAHPCANEDERRQLGHYGCRGIVVGNSYLQMLGLGSIDRKLKELVVSSKEVVTVVGTQRYNFEKALSLLRKVRAHARPISAFACSFVDKRLLGLFLNGDIYISESCLWNLKDAISVLVHEYAHHMGEDGSKAHEVEEGAIFGAIIEMLVEDSGDSGE